jgi:hypothetical protein
MGNVTAAEVTTALENSNKPNPALAGESRKKLIPWNRNPESLPNDSVREAVAYAVNCFI